MRLTALIALLAALAVGAACGGDPTGSREMPTAVVTTPVFTAPDARWPLTAARLDAARRLGVDPLAVELHNVQAVGLSGCLGVKPPPGQACKAFLAPGAVAFFRSGTQDLRYHIVGQQVVGPVQPGDVRDAGGDIGGLRFDLLAKLAVYAVDDSELRLRVPAAALAATAVLPDGSGAKIVVEGGPAQVSYGVDALAGVTPLSNAVALPGRLSNVQLAMREDLAKRLGEPPPQISVLDYRTVTWPDGCVGVQKPGGVCTQALVPGFLAVLSDGGGREYEYHGAGDSFVAASLEPFAVVTPPLP